MNSKTILLIIVILNLIVILKAKISEADILDKGKNVSIKGRLVKNNISWFLITQNDSINLKLAPQEFLAEKNLILKDDMLVELKGFLYKGNLLTISLKNNNSDIKIRDNQGNPLWGEEENYTGYRTDVTKCIGCKLCVSACPVKAINFENGVAKIDSEKCIQCGICVNGNANNFKGCPVKAISKE